MTTHQGFANYATFGVSVTLDNAREHHERMRAKVRELLDNPTVIEAVAAGTWEVEQGIRFAFADWLKDYAERLVEAGNPSLLAAQMAQAGLAEVDWENLADHYVTEAQRNP